jgi:hypothetical protein
MTSRMLQRSAPKSGLLKLKARIVAPGLNISEFRDQRASARNELRDLVVLSGQTEAGLARFFLISSNCCLLWILRLARAGIKNGDVILFPGHRY